MITREQIRLERIRRLSNLIQAIENVSVQCDGMEDFGQLKDDMARWSASVKRDMNDAIHGE